MKLKGKVFKFGNDINTDEIIPARYLNTSDPAELALYCMEDADPEFVKKKSEGDMIVAGDNFGCGSSREHAPIAIKAAGISCVIAKSFARIFYRNCINIGLPIFTSPEAVEVLEEGDSVEVDVTKGEITKRRGGRTFSSEIFPGFIKDMVRKGGLIAYAIEKAESLPKPNPKKRTKPVNAVKPSGKKTVREKSAKNKAKKSTTKVMNKKTAKKVVKKTVKKVVKKKAVKKKKK